MKKTFLILSISLLFPGTQAIAGGKWSSVEDPAEEAVTQKLDPNNNNNFKEESTVESPSEKLHIFGKLVDFKKVFAALLVFKKSLADLEIQIRPEDIEKKLPADIRDLPVDIFWKILEDFLTNPTEDDIKIRANVALEFLADPEYEFLHSSLLTLIKKSDLKFYAYQLAVQLGYSKETQDLLKQTLAKAYLEIELAFFSDPAEPTTTEGTTSQKHDQFVKILKNIGIKNNIRAHLKLLCDDDLITLAHHIFSTKINGYKFYKTRFILIHLKQLILECRERKIDLNWENEEGLTPLVWTTTVSQEWLTNGHTDALQLTMIKCGAQINYKNKFGKAFKDLAPQEVIENLIFRGVKELKN